MIPPNLTLYIIRHGECEHNIAGQAAGQDDHVSQAIRRTFTHRREDLLPACFKKQRLVPDQELVELNFEFGDMQADSENNCSNFVDTCPAGLSF